MEMLKTINFIIAVIFFVCYTYQFLYIPVPWLRKEKPHGPAKANRYAVLICARNEQRVIGDLIASLRGQTYDQSLLSIFVLADNCTDDTAMVARVAGAHVYERFHPLPENESTDRIIDQRIYPESENAKCRTFIA